MTRAIRNATISATPAFVYLVVSFAGRVILGWCDNSDANASGVFCLDGYSTETVFRAVLYELMPMLAVAWGGFLLGFLAFPRVRLSAASSLTLGTIASLSVLVLFNLLGLFALTLLPAAALVYSYRVAQRPDASLEHTHGG